MGKGPGRSKLKAWGEIRRGNKSLGSVWQSEKRLVEVKKVEGGSRWGVWIKVSGGSYKTIRGMGMEEGTLNVDRS